MAVTQPQHQPYVCSRGLRFWADLRKFQSRGCCSVAGAGEAGRLHLEVLDEAAGVPPQGAVVGDQAAALQQQQVVEGLQHSRCGVQPSRALYGISSAHKYRAVRDPWTEQDVTNAWRGGSTCSCSWQTSQ